MKGKKVTIIFEKSPFIDVKTYEGLRMGLGLTISNDDVSFVFTGHSVNALRNIKSPENIPDIKKPLQMLVELKKNFYVLDDGEKKDLNSPYPVKFISPDDLISLLKKSEVVIEC